jgi:hypothetical protein
MMRWILAGLALMGLAGCGSLPHPFERANPLPEASALTLPDATGITIEPVAGMPEDTARALAAAMVSALGDLDIPASVGVGNRASFKLAGRVAPDSPARIEWTLARPDGSSLGVETEPVPPESARESAVFLAAQARPVAERLALRIGAAAPNPPTPKRRVFVELADPASAEAKSTLAPALTAALAARGFDPTADGAGPVVRIRGELILTPAPTAGLTHVRLIWHITGESGGEAARLTQENDVPSRELPGRWGFFAPSIAAATTDDLVAVLAKIDPGR